MALVANAQIVGAPGELAPRARPPRPRARSGAMSTAMRYLSKVHIGFDFFAGRSASARCEPLRLRRCEQPLTAARRAGSWRTS